MLLREPHLIAFANPYWRLPNSPLFGHVCGTAPKKIKKINKILPG
jgi:hypothetical protein